MVDYEGWVRTNYFRIKPDKVEEFENLCKLLNSENGVIVEVRKREDEVYGYIGSISSITYGAQDEDSDIDEFFVEMMGIIDNDAMIWKEVGHGELRYLTSYTCIVTPEAIKFMDLDNIILERSKTHMNNPEYETQMGF